MGREIASVPDRNSLMAMGCGRRTPPAGCSVSGKTDEAYSLLNSLSKVFIGGNDENSMFEWLFRDILPKEDKFKTSDILCISDFGWVGIEHFAKGLIEEQKAAGMKFYGLNIGGAFGGWSDLNDDMWDDGGSPMSVCDNVWEYHAGRCVEVKGIKAASATRSRKR